MTKTEMMLHSLQDEVIKALEANDADKIRKLNRKLRDLEEYLTFERIAK